MTPSTVSMLAVGCFSSNCRLFAEVGSLDEYLTCVT
jgi:hypothetical protein